MNWNPAQEAELFIKIIQEDKELGFDVETSGLDYKHNHICGWGVSNGVQTAYVPVRHAGGDNISDPITFEKTISALVAKRTKPLVAHNAQFDYKFAAKHGVHIGNKIIDTMVQAALIDENKKGGYSLANCCRAYRITQKNPQELYNYLASKFGCHRTSKSMGEYHRLSGTDPIGVEYAKIDNIAVLELHQQQQRELYRDELDQVAGIERELTYFLAKMSLKGVKIDQAEREKVEKEIRALHLEAYRVIPLTEQLEPLNVRSRKDLQSYFEFHGIQDWPVTEKGNPSFNKLFLGQTDAGEVILHARKLDHFIDSFLSPLDQHVYGGRIHTTFNQTMSEYGGTRSGRLSSVGPNMQQIPKRDKFIGQIFRRMFIPDPGFTFVEYDYSQAEPRLFTHYSGEPTLVAGYNSSPAIDMHSVASQYMNIGRDEAKSLNLGMMYVMGAGKLAVQLGISLDEAKAIVSRWHRTFPKVSAFTKAAESRAKERGYVKTILGRRRHFPDPDFAYRSANGIVQGGSADILKYKIVQLGRWIENNNLDSRVQMLLNIHDAILFQIKDEYVDEYIPQIKTIMETVNGPPFNLTIPFVVDYKSGKNWRDATYGSSHS